MKLCLVFILAALACAHANVKAPVPRVEIAVYFETYCPDSIRFLTTMLYPTFQKLKDTDIMRVLIVPYGKAHYFQKSDGSYIFTCQHGLRECTGNTIENCLMKKTMYNPDVYLPVVQCMETAVDPVFAAQNCVKDNGLDWDAINACAEGAEGNELMHQAGVLTEHQNLNWVPWIVVNGITSIENVVLEGLETFLRSTRPGQPATIDQEFLSRLEMAKNHYDIREIFLKNASNLAPIRRMLPQTAS